MLLQEASTGSFTQNISKPRCRSGTAQRVNERQMQSVLRCCIHFNARSIPHRGHPKDTRGKKKEKEIQPRSAIPLCGLVTAATGREQLDRRRRALTSVIQHLSFSSPPLCYLFRQHMGQTGPVRLQQNTATCLTRGTTKASRVGTLLPLGLPR